jgi:hypothetical protein
MLTVVALHRSDDLVTDVLFPALGNEPRAAAHFLPGQLVVSLLETDQRLRLFAFRTLAPGSHGGSLVPGIRPGVDLLLATRTRLAASRLRNMLLYLRRRQIDPAGLSDDFWLSLGVVISSKLRGKGYLADLLSHEHLR